MNRYLTATKYPFRVKSAVLTFGRLLPVFPDKQTFSKSVGMSQRCHQETHAPQQPASLFDHLVGASRQRRRQFEPKSFGGLEIDREPVFRRLQKWQIAGAVDNAEVRGHAVSDSGFRAGGVRAAGGGERHEDLQEQLKPSDGRVFWD